MEREVKIDLIEARMKEVVNIDLVFRERWREKSIMISFEGREGKC